MQLLCLITSEWFGASLTRADLHGNVYFQGKLKGTPPWCGSFLLVPAFCLTFYGRDRRGISLLLFGAWHLPSEFCLSRKDAASHGHGGSEVNLAIRKRPPPQLLLQRLSIRKPKFERKYNKCAVCTAMRVCDNVIQQAFCLFPFIDFLDYSFWSTEVYYSSMPIKGKGKRRYIKHLLISLTSTFEQQKYIHRCRSKGMRFEKGKGDILKNERRQEGISGPELQCSIFFRIQKKDKL
jgi:hypothetical protein